MKKAGFNLRKWISSSERPIEWIDEEEGVPVKEMFKLSEEDGTEEQAHAENLWNLKNLKQQLGLYTNHYLTVLIIQDCDKTSCSQDSCVDCKKIERQHYAIPPTARAPTQFLVEGNPAFTYTGIDFAGLMFAKSGSTEKVVERV